MSSYQYLDSPSNHTRHGYSKAQTCFFKILHIISSIPACHNSIQEAYPSWGDNPLGPSRTGGIAVDLDPQLCSAAENGEFQCFAEKGSDSSAIEEEKAEAVGEKSGVTSSQVQSIKVDENGVNHEETKFEEEIRVGKEGDGKGSEENKHNCLDLLIEAAKVISGREEGSRREREKKRQQSWMVVDLYGGEMEERSGVPVVRTKRGRSQALPYRFRDSVMEPLKRRGRPHSHRPSTAASTSRKRLLGS